MARLTLWTLSILLSSASALAQPEAAVAEPPHRSVSRARRSGGGWYGWQTLAVDAAAVGLVVGGVSTDSEVIVGAGAFAFVFGGPSVHGAHEQTWRALASFGLRAGLPLTGFFVGHALGDRCAAGDDECNAYEAAGAGFLAGALLASLFDAAVLAHAPAPEPRVAPALALQERGVTLGLAGSF